MCRFSLLGRQVPSLSRPGPARPGPARPGPARPDPAWPGSDRAGPGWVEPSQKSTFYCSKTMIFDVIMCRFSLPRGQSPPPPSPARPGPARSGLTRPGSAQSVPARPGPGRTGPGEAGLSQAGLRSFESKNHGFIIVKHRFSRFLCVAFFFPRGQILSSLSPARPGPALLSLARPGSN